MPFGVSPADVLSLAAASAKFGEAYLNDALGLQEPAAVPFNLQPRSVLCDECQSIFSETRIFNSRWNKALESTNTLILRSDWDSNCKLCEILLSRSSHDPVKDSTNTEPLEIKFWLVNDPMFLYGSYLVRFETQNSEQRALKKFKLLVAAQKSETRSTTEDVYNLTSGEDSFDINDKAMPSWKPLSNETSSSKSLKYFDTWLRTCRKNHSACNKAQLHSRKFAPKRLLLIDRSGTELQVRLIETRKLKSKTQINYMTLSHCWGPIKIKRLLRENFNEFLKEVPMLSLPRLFVDAISITARASIKYLWIDSLSIIQDSINDWTRESAKMGLIYQHRYCNIAGTGFSDGSQGLFATRNTSLLEPIEHYIDCDIRLEGYPAIKQGPHLLIDYNIWKRGVGQAPLNGRAWVLQERVLSPRTIHFGFDQLFWECIGHIACELFPDGYPQRMPGYSFKSPPKPGQPPSEKIMKEVAEDEEEIAEIDRRVQEVADEVILSDGSSSDPGFNNDLHEKELAFLRARKEELVEQLTKRKNPSGTFNRGWCSGNEAWNRLMKTYSSCKLTIATDKLMAISGLAQNQQKEMDGGYLAGMWRTALEHQLIWKVVKPQTAPKPQRFRGPSWSWAYVDGKTEFAHSPDQDGGIIYPRIIDSNVVLAKNDDPFGLVSGGLLRLSGVLGVFKLVEEQETTMSVEKPTRETERIVSLHWDTKDLHDEYGKLFLQDPQTYRCFEKHDWQRTSEAMKQAVFFMPIRSMGIDPDFDMCITLLGLLLEPTQKSKGQFRRVGLYQSRESRAMVGEDGKLDWGSLVRNIEELDAQYYEDVDVDGIFSITIV